jgi:hypothetical protein
MQSSVIDYLPAITTTKEGKTYTVDWDYKGTDVDDVLDEKSDYINGYLNGLYNLLSAIKKLPDTYTYGHRTGRITGLTKEQADAFSQAIKLLYYPIIEERYTALMAEQA